MRNQTTMTRAEHLQSTFLHRRRYKCSLSYEDQFTSYSMLCRVILLTVNDSEKSHEVLLNGRSRTTLMEYLEETTPGTNTQRLKTSAVLKHHSVLRRYSSGSQLYVDLLCYNGRHTVLTPRHTHARTHARKQVSTHAHTHARTPARTHTCTHAHPHACTHARTHTRTHACTHAHTHTHTHAKVCT